MYAGAITSRDPSAAQRDDAAYPPSKHARLHKDHTAPKSARVAARGGPAGRGGARGAGTRGKAKMLADESRFSRPHPLQVTPHTLHLPILHITVSRMCRLNTNHGEQASTSSAVLPCPKVISDTNLHLVSTPHYTCCQPRSFVSAEWPASVSVTVASVCSLLVGKDHDSCCLLAPNAVACMYFLPF